jgi:hypothetical protein
MCEATAMESLDAVTRLVDDGRLLVAGPLAEKVEAFVEGRGPRCPVWRKCQEPGTAAMLTQLKARVAECKHAFHELESVRFCSELCVR